MGMLDYLIQANYVSVLENNIFIVGSNYLLPGLKLGSKRNLYAPVASNFSLSYIFIYIHQGLAYSSQTRSFVSFSEFQGKVLYHFGFSICLHSLIPTSGEFSQLRETISPTSPSRLTAVDRLLHLSAPDKKG